MERIVPIRIMERDKQEYRRLRKNARAKLRRLNKKYGVDVEGEIPLPKLENFSTRQQFNQWKEQINSFTNRSNQSYQFRKNQYGVVARVSDIKQMKWNTQRAQRNAQRMIDTLSDRGTIDEQGNQGMTIGQRFAMQLRPSQYGISMPADFDFENIRTQQVFDRRKWNMEDKASDNYYVKKAERMRDNFANLLEMDSGSNLDISDRIRKMSGLEFYEMQQIYFDVMDFALYDSDGGNINNVEMYEKIKGILDKNDRGEIDYTLSIFN